MSNKKVSDFPTVSPEDRSHISMALSWLPPDTLKSQVPDALLWEQTRIYHADLRQALNDYWTGRASSTRDEFFDLLVDFYLSFYGVLQIGWKHLEIDIQAKIGDEGLENFRAFAPTPGFALIRVLENDCYGMLVPGLTSTSYAEINLRKTADLNREHVRLQSIRDKPKKDRSTKEARQLRDYESKSRLSRSQYQELQGFYSGTLGILRKYRRKSRVLKRRIAVHESTKSHLMDEINRRSRNRRVERRKNGTLT